MKNKYTHYNGDLNYSNLSEQVYLKGWIANKRNLGKLVFLNLRDISGMIQLVVRPDCKEYNKIITLKIETIIEVKGFVRERVNKQRNKINFKDIEVMVSEIFILSEAKTLPFSISSNLITSLEDVRLKYRYLDLRRTEMKSYLIKRHDITQTVRQTLLKNKFLELETPLLSHSTPEGARDYLVPSRLYPSCFYALPQSPQIFKQLYMIAGFEKYFQIARCFRDEDLRSDRQPEFTQIDIEASFVEQKDIFILVEEIMIDLFYRFLKKTLISPFIKLSYNDAINYYGTDKPDLRFDMKIEDLTDYFDHGFVKKYSFSNKIIGIKILKKDFDFCINHEMIEKYIELIKNKYNLQLTTLIRENNLIKGVLRNYLIDNHFLKVDEIYFIFIDKIQTQFYIQQACGFLRNQLAHDLKLIDYSKDVLLWIVDFPLFEWDEQKMAFSALHHPFTAPNDIDLFKQNYDKVGAQAYDLVWNGYEIGSGSMRINDYNIQTLMFEKLGIHQTEIQKKFGFFIEALKYGTPPHGGIALGLDRLSMLFNQTDNIRDVIAFPKNQSSRDLMLETPDKIDKEQLEILNLKFLTNN